MKLERQTLPHNFYTQKALEIIKAYIEQWWHFNVEQDETGRVVFVKRSWELEYAPPQRIAAKMLCALNQKGIVNTIRTRSIDNRTIVWNGKPFKAKEANLVACLLLNKFPRASLEHHFGKELLESIEGKACNPLVAVQRQMLLDRIAAIKAEQYEKDDEIYKKFEEQINALQEARTKARDKSKLEYEAKIAEVNEQLKAIV